MTTWTRQQLSNYVTFKTGKLNSNAAVKNGKYPFFTCAQEIYKTNTWSFDTECVLLGGNNASAVYPIFYYKGKFDAYQRTYVIEPKNDNNIRFFYYAIRKKLEDLKQQSTGATTRFLTIGILNNLQIEAPEPPEQLRVASLLSTYDDLIENNEKRIKILEEMAERLYSEWFLKFKFPGHEKIKMFDSPLGKIPEGWEYGRLGDKILIKKGKNITKNTILPGDVPVIAAGIEPAYFHNQANTSAPVITISASGANAGFINLHFKDIWASDCSLINQETTPYVFYYYQLLSSKKNEIDNLQRGAAQPHVYPKDLMSLRTLHAPEPLIEEFENLISPIFKLIANLVHQNQNLTKTRDLLIPQLVTGRRELKS